MIVIKKSRSLLTREGVKEAQGSIQGATRENSAAASCELGGGKYGCL